jgi:hypothetical protein
VNDAWAAAVIGGPHPLQVITAGLQAVISNLLDKQLEPTSTAHFRSQWYPLASEACPVRASLSRLKGQKRCGADYGLIVIPGNAAYELWGMGHGSYKTAVGGLKGFFTKAARCEPNNVRTGRSPTNAGPDDVLPTFLQIKSYRTANP